MTDIAILAIAAYAAYSGWRRGLLVELMATLGLVVAIIAGFMFYDVMASLLGLSGTLTLNILAFAVVVLLVYRIWLWLARAASKALRLTALGWADGTLGSMLGLAKFVLAACALLHGLMFITHAPPHKVLGSSTAVPILLNAGDAIYATIAQSAPLLWRWYKASHAR